MFDAAQVESSKFEFDTLTVSVWGSEHYFLNCSQHEQPNLNLLVTFYWQI